MNDQYPKEVQGWLERIEKLWQNQAKTFPSIRYQYQFPVDVDYYRYLDSVVVDRDIQKLEGFIKEWLGYTYKIKSVLGWLRSVDYTSFELLRMFLPLALLPRLDAWNVSEMDALETEYRPKVFTREGEIVRLEKLLASLEQQIDDLEDSIEAIKFLASYQPKPLPFANFHRTAYNDGEVVVSFYSTKTQGRWTEPYLLMVSDSSIGTYHMEVRPLTDEEVAEQGVDLATAESDIWMLRASYDWVAPLDVYRFYFDHPGLADEHAEVLERSGFRVPTKLILLVRHFQKQGSK